MGSFDPKYLVFDGVLGCWFLDTASLFWLFQCPFWLSVDNLVHFVSWLGCLEFMFLVGWLKIEILFDEFWSFVAVQSNSKIVVILIVLDNRIAVVGRRSRSRIVESQSIDLSFHIACDCECPFLFCGGHRLVVRFHFRHHRFRHFRHCIHSAPCSRHGFYQRAYLLLRLAHI